MKQFKHLLVTCIALMSASFLHAQDYKIPVQNSKEGKLTLTDFPSNLPVEGYAGSEIIITSDLPGKAPDRAKGLKAIYADGTDNTGLAISMEKNGSNVTLQCLLPITKSANYKIKVPDNFNIKIDNECGSSGDVTVANMKGEVAIQNCMGIKMKNISGPVVLSSISGNINVSFSSISKEKPVSIASISGEIDVTVPASTGMDVEMETISGDVYSDFDFLRLIKR